jgi:hypothetical protein
MPSSLTPSRLLAWFIPKEYRADLISHLPVLLWQDVGVDIHGQAGLRVSDAPRDGLDVRARG